MPRNPGLSDAIPSGLPGDFDRQQRILEDLSGRLPAFPSSEPPISSGCWAFRKPRRKRMWLPGRGREFPEPTRALNPRTNPSPAFGTPPFEGERERERGPFISHLGAWGGVRTLGRTRGFRWMRSVGLLSPTLSSKGGEGVPVESVVAVSCARGSWPFRAFLDYAPPETLVYPYERICGEGGVLVP